MGEYRPEAIPDEWIWAEYWTRYFTDIEPQYSWVVLQEGQVVGYLNGTADIARFEAYLPRLALGLVWHTIRCRLLRRPASRQAIAAMLGALLRHEDALPHDVRRDFPATMHMNLLSGLRGGGVGWRLFCLFRDCMRELGVPGIHAQPLSINLPVQRLLAKAGFRPHSSRPTRAFRHVYPGAVEVQTWLMAL